MEIRDFTERVAELVAAQHAGDPAGELVVWLHMALRREASVSEIYGWSHLERRIQGIVAPPEIVRLVATTIANVWAQERAHAAYLDAVLAAVARAPTLHHRLGARIENLLGTVEGWVMSGRTSPSQLARMTAGLLLTIGRRVQDVPEFVATLSAMSFREFCRLNAELELTAIHGYERMLALLERAGDDAGLGATTTLAADVARMVRDERYHNDVFTTLADWFDAADGNALAASTSLRGCVTQLAEIRARAYQ